jgi:protein SCO1
VSLRRRRRLGVVLCLALLATAAALTVAAVRSTGASAASLHGDAVWAAGKQPAPAFSLTDQRGRRVTSASFRGGPWLLMFLDSRCTTLCPIAGHQIGSVERQMGSHRIPLVVVSVNPADTPWSVHRAAREWGWHGGWTWLMGTAAQLRPVWKAYHIGVMSTAKGISHTIAVYLMDGQGDERAGFLPPIATGALIQDVGLLRGGNA